MVYELTIERTRPGALPILTDAFAKVGCEVRNPKYGRLQGAWTSEFGCLNEFYCLWEYADLGARQSAVADLVQLPEWNSGYLRLISDAVVWRTELLMRAARTQSSARVVDTGPHIYELRIYDTLPGRLTEFVNLLTAALPLREKYSKSVGVWVPLAGDLNRVIHLWPFRDLVERGSVRDRVAKEKAWQEYRSAVLPLLAQQRSVLLSPTGFSPLR